MSDTSPISEVVVRSPTQVAKGAVTVEHGRVLNQVPVMLQKPTFPLRPLSQRFSK